MKLNIHGPWFKETGLGFLPVNLAGIVVAIAVLIFNGIYFMAVDKNSHSASDTLINFFVGFTCAAFWYQWIAKRTS